MRVLFSVFLLITLSILFVSSGQNIAAAATNLGLAENAYVAISVDSSNVILSPSPSTGGLASGSVNITTSTNVMAGYNLRISAAVNTLNPMTPPNSTPVTAVGDGVTTGTLLNPIALTDDTWGFALNAVSTSTPNNTILNGFDLSYNTPVPSNTSKWAQVPTIDTVIKNTTLAANEDVTTVYYGTKITNLPIDTYVGTVTYSAVANAQSFSTPTIIRIIPNFGVTTGGTEIAIIGTGFTFDDQSITTAITIDGVACLDVSINSDSPFIGQDTINCTTPMHVAGAMDVIVHTWGGTATLPGGFTYIISNLGEPPAALPPRGGVLDVVPNTGWEGDVIYITSNNLFTNVSDVTVGNVACDEYEVVDLGLISCVLPAQTAGTTNDVAVINNGSNIINANTYLHMKIIYFDPNRTELIGSTPSSNITFSDFTPNDCVNMSMQQIVFLTDNRDNQTYRIRKMPDNKCWMVDSLKYAYGNFTTSGFLTIDGTQDAGTNNFEIAKYVNPMANVNCYGATNMPVDTLTRCGWLYNWYTATASSGTHNITTAGVQTTESICPANFRLPTATSGAGGATTDGTVATAADFPVLNTSMNNGTLSTGNTLNYPAGWTPTGMWEGVYNGYFAAGFYSQGANGRYWAATNATSTNAYSTLISAASVGPGTYSLAKHYGFSVRCVMP